MAYRLCSISYIPKFAAYTWSWKVGLNQIHFSEKHGYFPTTLLNLRKNFISWLYPFGLKRLDFLPPTILILYFFIRNVMNFKGGNGKDETFWAIVVLCTDDPSQNNYFSEFKIWHGLVLDSALKNGTCSLVCSTPNLIHASIGFCDWPRFLCR